jgi:uncharacterized protein YceK
MALLALATLSNVFGCAALMNVKCGEAKVFGGVRTDAAASLAIVPTLAVCCGLKSDSDFEILTPPACLALQCLALVDLPFSFVADTLLLPVAVGRAMEAKARAEAIREAADHDSARSD